MLMNREDFGAFVERFEILPFPQPPPPAAKQSLSGLTFAIKDMYVFSQTRYTVTLFVYGLLVVAFVFVCVIVCISNICTVQEWIFLMEEQVL